MRTVLELHLTGIRSLLSVVHTPRVEIKLSSIATGYGVFARTPLMAGQVVCLYPGVYTPPPYYATHFGRYGWRMVGEEDASILPEESYLANRISPSGLPVEENAYILNLQTVGGYLDGNCRKVSTASFIDSTNKNQAQYNNVLSMERNLDENPSACGHLVNHSSDAFNVAFESFLWNDSILGYNDECEKYYKIPNAIRQDGSPWYFDGERIVYFERLDEKTFRNYTPLGGAVLVTQRDVEQNEELLVDYKLKRPYPKWAKDWYKDN
jgi:hypothetical protein